MSVKPMAGFDMDNRDPNNINDHLQVRETATFVPGLSTSYMEHYILSREKFVLGCVNSRLSPGRGITRSMI